MFDELMMRFRADKFLSDDFTGFLEATRTLSFTWPVIDILPDSSEMLSLEEVAFYLILHILF